METIRDWCAKNGIHEAVFTTTVVVLDDLSTEELCAQHNAATAEFDPRPVMGWDKIKPLYTQHRPGEKPPPMHADTLKVFGLAVGKRLGGEGHLGAPGPRADPNERAKP